MKLKDYDSELIKSKSTKLFWASIAIIVFFVLAIVDFVSGYWILGIIWALNVFVWCGTAVTMSQNIERLKEAYDILQDTQALPKHQIRIRELADLKKKYLETKDYEDFLTFKNKSSYYEELITQEVLEELASKQRTEELLEEEQ